jgi:LmbE family N-acetylglucosaminyl deacetylase
MGSGGALIGFVAGSLVILLAAPASLRRDLAWRPSVLRERARWVETGDIALAQLIVYTLIGADVVLVALLAAHDAESAGYQALSTLAKAPIYVAAGTVAVAFPLLRSRQADTHSIVTATMRSFTVLSFSAAAVVATAPPELMLLVFPERYADSLTLLPVLAAAGVGYAALTLFSSVLLGLRAYRRCQLGLLTAVVLMPAAWWWAGSWAASPASPSGWRWPRWSPPRRCGPRPPRCCRVPAPHGAARPAGRRRAGRPARARELRSGPVGDHGAGAGRSGAPAAAAPRRRSDEPTGEAMTDPLSAFLHEALAGDRGVLVLSAHLDDAILSCGALLTTLARQAPVTVATVFTEAGPPPHTWAARAFLRQCTIGDAAELYEARRQEDIDVLTGLGVAHVHLGAPDALFRRREVGPAAARVGRAVPEVVHRYPTFRFDIDKGRVARGDRALLDRLDAERRELADRIDAALVLGPVGVGRHVDHLLTRTLAERQPQPTVLYADFPYVLRDAPDAGYLAARRLTPVTWNRDLDAKAVLIKGYHTQVEALFPRPGRSPRCTSPGGWTIPAPTRTRWWPPCWRMHAAARNRRSSSARRTTTCCSSPAGATSSPPTCGSSCPTPTWSRSWSTRRPSRSWRCAPSCRFRTAICWTSPGPSSTTG